MSRREMRPASHRKPEADRGHRSRSRSRDSFSDDDMSSSLSSSASSTSSSMGSSHRKSSKRLSSRRRDKRGKRSGSSTVDSPSLLPPLSKARPPIAGNPASSGTTGQDVVQVKMEQPYAQQVDWQSSEYLISYTGTLKDLYSKADANGNVSLLELDGIKIESTHPEIHDRAMKIRSEASASLQSRSSFKANPAEFGSHGEVAHKACILSAHNSFPVDLTVRLDNIVGSSKSVVYCGNPHERQQHLSFSICSGEKITAPKDVLVTDFKSKEEFVFFGTFKKFTPNNLEDGVQPYTPLKIKNKDGTTTTVDRCLVPHEWKPRERAHPVVTLVQQEVPKTWSKKEQKLYGGTFPPHIMTKSNDNPGYFILSKAVFDEYREKCSKFLLEKHPLSDVANPHGVLHLTHRDRYTAVDTPVSSKMSLSGMASEASGRSAWITNPEIATGKLSEQEKADALDVVHKMYARVKILSHRPARLVDK